MTWRRLLVPLRLLLSGGLLVYLIWHAEPARIWQSWRAINPSLFILALLLQFAGIALSAAKWGVLLAARQQPQPFAWLLRSYLVGQFASNFLPTSVGGDAVRASQLSRRIGSFSQASASIFIERLTGFLALSLIANVALALTSLGNFGIRLSSVLGVSLLSTIVTLAALGALVGSFGASWLQRRFGFLPHALKGPVERMAQAITNYAPRGWKLALVLSLSLLYQCLLIVIHIVCGIALGIDAPLLLYAVMVPITDILGLAPIFVNNLGARELVFTTYLAQSGVLPATAIALAFLVFTIKLLVSLLGGFVSLFPIKPGAAREVPEQI